MQPIAPVNPDWGNVVLVAGMSGAGKSHFLRRRMDPAPLPIREQLGFSEALEWDGIDLQTLSLERNPLCTHVCVHYELNRGGSMIENGIKFDRDRRLWDKLSGIENPIIVTIEASAETLWLRYKERQSRFQEWRRTGHASHRTYLEEADVCRLIEAQIGAADRILDMWEKFCKSEGFKNLWSIPATGGSLTRKGGRGVSAEP